MEYRKNYTNINKIIDSTTDKMRNVNITRIMEIITNIMIILMFGISLYAISSIAAAEKRNRQTIERIEYVINLERQSEWVKAQRKLNQQKWEEQEQIKRRSLTNIVQPE